ncbi:MAG TPA: hypothetical protein VN316_01890 [candidate division Zixibacteria bacterium]|nr:hypothetical protein [candidate division Zixibacteria bacterium]
MKFYGRRLFNLAIGITLLIIILLSGDTGAVPIEEWNKTFGRADINSASSVQQTLDGGYILAGQIMYRAGDSDAWLIKTDANGDLQWNRTFGRAHNGQVNRTFLGNNDWANSVQQTSDGGYILAGGTASYGAGLSDAWLIKTDANGSEQWNRTFGGTGRDEAYSVQQTYDGAYILTGRLDGAKDVNAWLIKTDTNGYEQWNRAVGGAGFDET